MLDSTVVYSKDIFVSIVCLEGVFDTIFCSKDVLASVICTIVYSKDVLITIVYLKNVLNSTAMDTSAAINKLPLDVLHWQPCHVIVILNHIYSKKGSSTPTE